jgi:transcriptional regulator with XRE-family HTH domain
MESIDNILSFIDKTPDAILKTVADHVKERRLEKNYTQKAMASRAGIPLGTYRRFETSGEISFRGLVLIGLALGMTSEFDQLFSTPAYRSMDELLNIKESKKRKRGSRNG